jgi:hypothetical protein
MATANAAAHMTSTNATAHMAASTTTATRTSKAAHIFDSLHSHNRWVWCALNGMLLSELLIELTESR